MSTTSAGGDPVLLVHGYMDDSASPWWGRARRRLDRAGYDRDRVRVLDQGAGLTTVGSPVDYARAVRDAARDLAASTGGSVDVVAHSMGGLSARWAVERLDADEYVDDLVTLGTPHQGTHLAVLGMATPGGKAMLPGSSFLSTLNEGSLARGVDYTAVWSDADEAISPSTNATLDADWFPSMLGARNVRLRGVSHMGLVRDPGRFDRYVDFLD